MNKLNEDAAGSGSDELKSVLNPGKSIKVQKTFARNAKSAGRWGRTNGELPLLVLLRMIWSRASDGFRLSGAH